MAATTTFSWSGKTKDGKVQKGQTAAANKDEVMNILRKQGIMVTSVSSSGGMSIGQKLSGMGGGGVTEKDIIVFTRQFATMIDAGLPLVQCLEILENQTENKTLAKVIGLVRGDVEAGSTYADALGKHPKVFDNLYVNLVAAGEVGGILDTILGRLTAYIEKSMKLKKQIKSAMVYPAVVMTVAVGVISVLMIFVIPMFAKMFSDLGGTLPLPTQIVMSISYFMTSKKMIFVVAAIIGTFFGIKSFYATPKGKLLIDKLLLKAPIFGPLIRKVAVSKFTRTLGTLMGAGVPIMDGLEIVARTAGNKVVELAVMDTRASISEGKNLSDPLAKSGVFPPMVTQMISVGESTGALDAMLSKIADFYDDEVDNAVGAMTAALEPMLMVFLGISVGFIIIAMYLPIFQLASLVG
ncbi:MAG: type II secretion system F family protein [Nitrospirae bacterium]|nr:type II secretion system F family protein [Nitrospirota bacterium]MBI5694456.1 type II secretion system F family protein [Nitrospirota bacterium]